MKNAFNVTFGVLILIALTLAIIPTLPDEIHWRWASHKDESTSYESYVKIWPEGRHSAEARVLSDAHGWKEAVMTNTVQGFKRYIQLHGDGKHVVEAKDKIDSLQWQGVTTLNTTQGFELYLRLHGEGKHIAEAKDKIDSLQWQEATLSNTIQGFERYLQLHGDGKHVAEAKDKIDSLQWQEATTANTIRSYRSYAATHPLGKFAQQAKTKASALRIDQSTYDAALRAGTVASLRAFLTDYPGHKKESEAKQAIKDITEGRDIMDLLKEKKIEIKTEGSGIESVIVNIRRLVPYALTVRIPVGTYFISANTSSQNMVTTAETRIRLDTDYWQNETLDAACANRPRNIPNSDDSFTVQRSPHQAELARLMPVLESAGVSYAVRQAAVWIVTDNADYDDLGILVSRSQFQYFGGTRQINEYEAAQAMKICDEAGIKIKRKSIWGDLQRIINGLEDGDLKKWLENKK